MVSHNVELGEDELVMIQRRSPALLESLNNFKTTYAESKNSSNGRMSSSVPCAS